MKLDKSAFDKMHLGWFGDEDDTPVPQSFEDDDFEVVDEKDYVPEEEADKVSMSRDEYEELVSKGKAESSDMGLERLAEAINKQKGVPEPAQGVAPQQSGETWEQYMKRVNDEIFGDNPAGVISDMIQRVAGGYVGQMGQTMMKQAKKLMELDPDKGKYYRKYKGEIEEKLKKYPVNVQNNPEALEGAYKEVMAEHQEDIISETLEDRVEKAVAERLKAMGIGEDEPGEGAAKRGKFYETKTQSRGSGSAGRKRQVVMTEADKQRALAMGVDNKTYAKYYKK